ncbi:Uncharacterised protein [Mycobacteroides abscessus subsp. abscessus]|nr:Uncharacterised protein [Mycobacteroides abscessus subsp. abscessus]
MAKTTALRPNLATSRHPRADVNAIASELPVMINAALSGAKPKPSIR